MKKTKSIIALMAISMVLFSCGNKSGEKKTEQKDSIATTTEKKPEVNPNEVKIGNQTWAVKNLNVSTFSNGDPIPEAKTVKEFEAAGNKGKPMSYFSKNDPVNGDKYGKIYNWYAATDPRGIAPKGWHVPSEGEWNELINFLGGEDEAAKKIMSASVEGGGNSSGFSAIETPDIQGTLGDNGDVYYLRWWTTSEQSKNNGQTSFIQNHRSIITSWLRKENGIFIRCIKD
ncbi:MAG: fibrobacter succinogenes major paralogous domain-containing protein [Bacteroidota bacterium]